MIGNLLPQIEQALGDTLTRGTSVLCAVSGGPDSMALLHILRQLGREQGFLVSAAHFNHGIRSAAILDEAFVEDQCRQWDVPLWTGRADVPAMAASEGKTIEQAARDARYLFLRGIAAKIGAEKIALGHHMDDQAETLLLNLMRGTGLSGLRGMQSVRRDLIRPLLFLRKSKILDYLNENALPYRIDETNESEDYTRNKVRKLIVEFERINPSFVTGASRTSQLLAKDDDALNRIAHNLRKDNARGTGVDVNALKKADPAIAARVMRLLAIEAGLIADFEHKHVLDVLALCGNGHTGASLCLPHGFVARLDYGALSIALQPDAERIEDTMLNLDGVTHTSAGDFIAALVEKPADLAQGWPLTVYVNPEAMRGAIVRSRREGDRISPLGASGSKKLKDFLIDKKMDRRLRNLPVVARNGNILWALCGAISESVRLDEQKQVLRIAFEPAQHWQNCTLFD